MISFRPNWLLTKLIMVVLLLLTGSCGDEEFEGIPNEESSVTSPLKVNSSTRCSTFTLVKPKLDFLFVWDNSTSTVFINSQTKAQLNNLISFVGDKYDTHILIAPLIPTHPTDVNRDARLIAETLPSPSVAGMMISQDQAANTLDNYFLNQQPGNLEAGATRAYDLLQANITNGIFRPGAYTIVVVMSNDDDNKWAQGVGIPSAVEQQEYIKEMTNKLLCTRGNYNPAPGYTCNGTGFGINSQQFRFVSIVAHNPFPGVCTGIGLWRQNAVYKTLSSNIFNAPYTNGAPTPSSPGPLGPDTFNICDQSSFNNYLQNINSAITEEIIKHHYQFWPVATSDATVRIDPNEIRVIKSEVEHVRLTPPVPPGSHGFTYQDVVQTVNTRSAPTPGEPFTGKVVELHGSARVTYPECLTIIFKEPNDLFGYIALKAKPLESSIVVKINGTVIPQNSTNGWQLVKSGGQPAFRNEQNIKIAKPPEIAFGTSDYVEGSPAVNKAGYLIQLFGTAIYTNGATIEVTFDPSN